MVRPKQQTGSDWTTALADTFKFLLILIFLLPIWAYILNIYSFLLRDGTEFDFETGNNRKFEPRRATSRGDGAALAICQSFDLVLTGGCLAAHCGSGSPNVSFLFFVQIFVYEERCSRKI